ncbi:hypothetical protein GCM10007857_31400 [Bradyrhizobium iriomotense]|uniref:Uncharacterized protein n=1 Tax=Bradyrhizobium iriomotense TaxID=441950 RepID=A0ABQ6AW56_9BRAD|nr:hypothetical protein GCM10007857_31400 [Bradyrhizobium iriomotense]
MAAQPSWPVFIGKEFGTSVGGLFLALPAIFCASATLIERHERRTKEKAGLSGERRGREAAALDAAGAGLGSVGLIAFAAAFCLVVPASITGAFASALLAWGTVAVSMWWLRRKLRIVRLRRWQDRTSANRLLPHRQKLVHLGRGLKLLDPGCDQIAQPSDRRSCKLFFESKSLLFEPLLECVGLRSFPHRGLSVVAGPGCWPSVRVAQ